MLHKSFTYELLYRCINESNEYLILIGINQLILLVNSVVFLTNEIIFSFIY